MKNWRVVNQQKFKGFEGYVNEGLKGTNLQPYFSLPPVDTTLGFQLEPGGTTAVAVLVKNNQIFCVSWYIGSF